MGTELDKGFLGGGGLGQHIANLCLILVDAGFGSNSVLTAPLA